MGCGCKGSSYEAPDRAAARREQRAERIKAQAERRQRRVTTTINDPSNFAGWSPPGDATTQE